MKELKMRYYFPKNQLKNDARRGSVPCGSAVRAPKPLQQAAACKQYHIKEKAINNLHMQLVFISVKSKLTT